MHVIARKILWKFSDAYPDAKEPLDRWWVICRKNNSSSFSELKKTFGTAAMVGRCVIFNIGGGKYRKFSTVNGRYILTIFANWLKNSMLNLHLLYSCFKLIAIPNRNCLTHLIKQSACKELMS